MVVQPLQGATAHELLRSRAFQCLRCPESLAPPSWSLEDLAGRLVELSAGNASMQLSSACELLCDAQLHGEPAAWILAGESTFYPPDLAAMGVDLAALAVIRPHGTPGLGHTESDRDEHRALRAADLLLRSGAFGLLLIDLPQLPMLPLAAQTRLAGLAKRHGTTVLFLTRNQNREPSASLGSLISLHLSATRQQRAASSDQDGGGFTCQLKALKDKRRGPGWQLQLERYHGPPGLR